MSEEENKADIIFPKWANSVGAIIGLVLLLVLGAVVFAFWYWASPKNLNTGYSPKQPIPFSHKIHAGKLGMDCRYCHYTVDIAAHAAIPPSETCMNCHKIIKKDSPHIKKVKESFETDTPMEWVQIHNLPDYTYFEHSRHVNSGISCKSCHGRVDQMKQVYQAEPLSMGWCLDCHRAPEKHLRPKNQVTNLAWESKDQHTLGKQLKEAYHINPREDCSTCHR